jgi:drug/metabolite transporter (DMT)-like permease
MRGERGVSSWLLFLGPCLIWGSTWLTIKFQLGIVPPEVSVAYRFGLASLLLFAWCAIRGVSLAFDARTHASFALMGVLQYGINYVLVYVSEGSLTSGLVAVIFVLIVAWNLAGARLFFGRPLPPAVVAGAALGMAGVTLVFWPEVARVGEGHAWGFVTAIAATLAASAGNLWSERVYARDVGVAPSTAWATLYASIAVAIYCAVRGVPFRFDASLAYIASLLYLALFGSVFAFLAYLTLLRRIGAGRAGYTAVVIPVLAMAMSTMFEGYRWSPLALVGMMLVLAGNVLVLRGKQRIATIAPAPAVRA